MKEKKCQSEMPGNRLGLMTFGIFRLLGLERKEVEAG
jgi:hypothetical protein